MKASKIFLVKPYKLPVSKPESKQNSTNKDISKEVKINTVQLKLPSDCKYMSNKGEIIKLDEKQANSNAFAKVEPEPKINKNNTIHPKFSNKNLAKVQIGNDDK